MICVRSVSVSPSSVTIRAGDWFTCATAEVCPTNATCDEVLWHSSNESVAGVNSAIGYIYGLSPGTARIYATATDGSGASDYLVVTVTSGNSTVYVNSEDINDHDKIIDNYYRDYDCSGEGVEDYCYCTYCEDYYSDEKTISENHCAHLDDGNVKALDDEVCLYKCNDTTCANAEGEKDKLNIRDTSEKNNGKKEKSFEYYSDNEYKNELI